MIPGKEGFGSTTEAHASNMEAHDFDLEARWSTARELIQRHINLLSISFGIYNQSDLLLEDLLRKDLKLEGGRGVRENEVKEDDGDLEGERA